MQNCLGIVEFCLSFRNGEDVTCRVTDVGTIRDFGWGLLHRSTHRDPEYHGGDPGIWYSRLGGKSVMVVYYERTAITNAGVRSLLHHVGLAMNSQS